MTIDNDDWNWEGVEEKANPNEVHQVVIHPQKATIWCGFRADCIIGLVDFIESSVLE